MLNCLSSSVRSIAKFAFKGSGLSNITVPTSVSSIDEVYLTQSFEYFVLKIILFWTNCYEVFVCFCCCFAICVSADLRNRHIGFVLLQLREAEVDLHPNVRF